MRSLVPAQPLANRAARVLLAAALAFGIATSTAQGVTVAASSAPVEQHAEVAGRNLGRNLG